MVGEIAFHVREGDAMIRSADDERVIGETRLIKGSEDPAHARVQPAGRDGEVGKVLSRRRCVRHRQRRANVPPVAQWLAAVVPLNARAGAVRQPETDGQQERPGGPAAQILDRPHGDHVVVVHSRHGRHVDDIAVAQQMPPLVRHLVLKAGDDRLVSMPRQVVRQVPAVVVRGHLTAAIHQANHAVGVRPAPRQQRGPAG